MDRPVVGEGRRDVAPAEAVEDLTVLVRAAQPLGLLLAAGGRFAVGGGMESRLRLPYTVGEDRLREAVRRLRQAWDVASETTPPETPWPPLVA